VSSLRAAVGSFDPGAYDPVRIRAHAEQWREERFDAEFRAEVEALSAPG
jgi:hypothetical protein